MCRIPSTMWLSFQIFFTLWKTNYVVPLPHQNPLCESADKPCEFENPGTCHMKYYKLNSSECRDLMFDDRSQRLKVVDDLLGKVQVKSFYYNIFSYKMTAFNVSFSDIKWKHMKFRFKQIDNDMKNTCREFFIMTNTTINDLVYDCIWSNETYEGKTFVFEYEASSELRKIYKKFFFNVPFAKNIDESQTQIENWEIFTYVEAESNLNGLRSTFYLHWQPVPKKFFVNQYRISIISNDTGTLQVIHSLNVVCNTTECSYMCSKWYGTLQFAIQPVCNKTTSCSTSKSIFLMIDGKKSKSLLIGVIAIIGVPGVFYFLFILVKYILNKKVKRMSSVPKLLIVYSSSVPLHVNVIFHLVDYLKDQCNVEPLMDELHILCSESWDPFKWCNEAFRSADCIMVVASPFHERKDMSDSVYQNVDTLLLRLLQEHLGSHNNKKKLFVLMLPYATKNDIPSEAMNLRRFYFPCDLNKIVRFIHPDWFLANFLSSMKWDDKEESKLLEEKLNEAIEEAQRSLKNYKLSPVAESQRNDEELNSDHELMTLRKKPSHGCDIEARTKDSIKEKAKEYFSYYPGDIEDNLLSEDDTRVRLVSTEAPAQDQNIFNLHELKL